LFCTLHPAPLSFLCLFGPCARLTLFFPHPFVGAWCRGLFWGPAWDYSSYSFSPPSLLCTTFTVTVFLKLVPGKVFLSTKTILPWSVRVPQFSLPAPPFTRTVPPRNFPSLFPACSWRPFSPPARPRGAFLPLSPSLSLVPFWPFFSSPTVLFHFFLPFFTPCFARFLRRFLGPLSPRVVAFCDPLPTNRPSLSCLFLPLHFFTVSPFWAFIIPRMAHCPSSIQRGAAHPPFFCGPTPSSRIGSVGSEYECPFLFFSSSSP